jgi:hypothetical protein
MICRLEPDPACIVFLPVSHPISPVDWFGMESGTVGAPFVASRFA